jgi:hypothetical protein
MSNIRDVLQHPQATEQTDEMEKAISKIAEIMSYSGDIKRLMQLTRVDDGERQALSILYAVNHGKLRSKAINDYLFAYFSSANSKKGKSRDEMIDIVKAATPQVPRGFWGRMKDRFSFQ